MRENHENILRLLHSVAFNAPSGRSFARIAEKLAMPYSTLSNQLNENDERHKFGVMLLPAFMDVTDSDAPVEYLAALRGGVFVRLPEVCRETISPDQFARVVREFGEFLTAATESITDGRITRDECARIQREGREAVAAIYSIMLCIE